jgi:hypothetical protein
VFKLGKVTSKALLNAEGAEDFAKVVEKISLCVPL